MTDKTISELDAGGPAQDADELPAQRGAANVKLTRAEILGALPAAVAALIAADIGLDARVTALESSTGGGSDPLEAQVFS